MRKVDTACIIDDDPIYVFGTRLLMEDVDFCNDIMVFEDGKQALDTLKPRLLSGENLPDIILLDINMPVMDGWQFLDEFTKIPSPKKITIYMVTSSVDQMDAERAKAYEAVSDYVVKPLSLKKLQEIQAEL